MIWSGPPAAPGGTDEGQPPEVILRKTEQSVSMAAWIIWTALGSGYRGSSRTRTVPPARDLCTEFRRCYPPVATWSYE